MIPVRCFTCGKPIGSYYYKFVERVKRGEDPERVLDGSTIQMCSINWLRLRRNITRRRLSPKSMKESSTSWTNSLLDNLLLKLGAIVSCFSESIVCFSQAFLSTFDCSYEFMTCFGTCAHHFARAEYNKGHLRSLHLVSQSGKLIRFINRLR